VGDGEMKLFEPITLLIGTFLIVFFEAAFPVFRRLFGAQVDFLPALAVYAGLSTSFVTVMVVSVTGGLLFDSLSANPLGISVLPLLIVGFLVALRRDLILRDQVFAQWILGLAASALVPLITVLMLLTQGKSPLLGWGSLWQWLVMIAGGGIATPAVFAFFNWINRMFGYQPTVETSFRPDREIRRGRM
jgi:rod shape-determining protein MreD